jgi:hypothetical protein
MNRSRFAQGIVMSGKNTLYNPAIAAKLLDALGITNDNFDDEDLFIIEPARGQRASDPSQYAIYRIPSLSAERLQIYAGLMAEDRPLNASKEDVQAAFHAIPFYNPDDEHIAGREGIRIIKNDDVLVKVRNQEYQLPSYANIMWQPNLAGKLLSRFAAANARYSFFGGSDPGPDALLPETGYWIDLRNFRSTLHDIEGYPLSSGGGSVKGSVIHPVHGGQIDADQMPDYIDVDEFSTGDGQVADNVYVVAWNDPENPKPGEYAIYCMTRAYWTERMSELELATNDVSQKNLVKYIIDAQSQVAALSDWEANAIGIANHGLCCVVNLSSFTR